MNEGVQGGDLYRALFIMDGGKCVVSEGPEDTLPGMYKVNVDADKEQILDLAYLLMAWKDLGRTIMNGNESGKRKNSVSESAKYGCSVVDDASSVPLSRTGDMARFVEEVFNPPSVTRVGNSWRVTFLCLYPDLGNSLRRIEIEIRDEGKARVKNRRTGLRIEMGALAKDDKFSEFR